MLKKLFSIGLAVALLFGACSCSAKNGQKDATTKTLRITYYNGKYSDEWIKTLAAAFKKLNPGVNIVLSGDSSVDSKIGFTLLSGKDEPDIAFVSKTNWQTWADAGYMADLTALYSQAENGGKSIADKLQPDVKGYSAYKGSYRIMPWGDGVTGLIYNQKMFEQNGWVLPATTVNLSSLIETIKAARVTPFAWSGQNMGYWNYAVNDWWAQSEGATGMQTYLQMGSPDVYKQSGRFTALKTFQSILSNAQNSVDNPTGIDAKKAIDEFYNGNAAMMPGGYLTLMETKYKAPTGFKMGIMKLPTVSGAKQSDIGSTLAGDFAFIPSKARNIALAKKFFAFMASDQALLLFTQKTGAPAPFVYNVASVKGLDSLGQSEIELWQKMTKVTMYSNNPIYYNNFLDWPYEGSPLMEIFSGAETAQTAFDMNYQYAASHWVTSK